MNIPKCCQTFSYKLWGGKSPVDWKLSQSDVSLKQRCLCTLSIQTGQTVSPSQPVPPVLVPLICLRWKDLLWGRLQSRDGSTSPLWRGESKCCRAKRSMQARKRRGRDKDSERQKEKEEKIIGRGSGKEPLSWLKSCSHTMKLQSCASKISKAKSLNW